MNDEVVDQLEWCLELCQKFESDGKNDIEISLGNDNKDRASEENVKLKASRMKLSWRGGKGIEAQAVFLEPKEQSADWYFGTDGKILKVKGNKKSNEEDPHNFLMGQKTVKKNKHQSERKWRSNYQPNSHVAIKS